MQDKPVVKYVKLDSSDIKVGSCAKIVAIDHPVLGTEVIITSTVLEINPEGFETRNTIYKR